MPALYAAYAAAIDAFSVAASSMLLYGVMQTLPLMPYFRYTSPYATPLRYYMRDVYVTQRARR